MQTVHEGCIHREQILQFLKPVRMWVADIENVSYVIRQFLSQVLHLGCSHEDRYGSIAARPPQLRHVIPGPTKTSPVPVETSLFSYSRRCIGCTFIGY